MGGVIAQEFCRAYPERLLSLILADTSHGGDEQHWKDRLALFRSSDPVDFARHRAPKLFSPDAPPELIDEAVSIMSEVRPSGYEHAAKAMAAANTGGALSGAPIPILLIWGSEDEITPVWRDVPPGARLVVIPGAGHLSYAECPGQFNTIVRNFLHDN
jgi:pimeloyl-ACP methyl ester carboxylesterase